jgi:hypothetical protein
MRTWGWIALGALALASACGGSDKKDSDVAGIDLVGTDATGTDTAQPDAVATDTAQPDAAATDTAQPDTAPVEHSSSHAYKGHENDTDMTYFINVYGNAWATRLDDCQTCHRGGEVTSNGKTVFKNACDTCHLVIHPDATLTGNVPAAYVDTLNPYGKAYLDAGRTKDALKAIAADDSDGDTFSNADEIADLKYPGDPASKPGQTVAPARTFTWDQLLALPAHSEFILANSTKQQYDFYATYEGVKLLELMKAAGVDPDDPEITGLTVIAPDGFMTDVDMSAVKNPFPAGTFYGGLDTATLGTDCGFVTYPDVLPADVSGGATIPGTPWVLLAWNRDGAAMDTSVLDPVTGKIDGEGPYRLVVPQLTPGKPDRGLKYSPTQCNDGYDFDEAADHNAGSMVRGVVAVRVNPLPAGVEDLDFQNGGWAFIDGKEVLVYGHGVTVP